MTANRDIDFAVSRTFGAYFDGEPYPALSGGDRTPLEGRMLADLLDGLVQQVRALREEQSGQREQVRQLTEWKNAMVKRMAEKQGTPLPTAKPPIKEEAPGTVTPRRDPPIEDKGTYL